MHRINKTIANRINMVTTCNLREDLLKVPEDMIIHTVATRNIANLL